MKKSPATTVLLTILVASSLLSLWFCYLYIKTARDLRDLQRNVSGPQAYRAAFGSLVKEVMDYSDKDPSINPVLEAAGFKAAKAPFLPPTSKPAGK
jgi:hypothetical protein